MMPKHEFDAFERHMVNALRTGAVISAPPPCAKKLEAMMRDTRDVVVGGSNIGPRRPGNDVVEVYNEAPGMGW